MTNCMVCGKPFDNEHWLLGQTPGGEPELTVLRNMRCPACWEKSNAEPHCRIFPGDEPDCPKTLKNYRVS